MKKTLILLLCLGLFGCATTAKYEARLNNLVGQTENFLITAWGVPDKEYRLKDGKKAVEYVRKDTIRSGGHTYTYPQTVYQSGTIDGKPYSGTATQYVTEITPVEKFKLFCNTSFVINSSGKVESWHHEGNNCVSQ
ncbi:MAG: hypothetical protein COV73_05055 [Candidatus Omnitrophica bacterium CG11_big_fil_rev_8_21_14_0_20_43_6]|nr:MAG: hypothetical protein COV73_05055 [Candidatus Omnitrophica bacterium CG11_big_fil_rev_8_21_14_0_20_43_6]